MPERGTINLFAKALTEGVESVDILVEIGSHNRVVIDKVFGPAAFDELRVSCDVERWEWVIERLHSPCTDLGEPTGPAEWVVVSRVAAATD